eukprot:6210257-Pleurochrysis_carterae.AAC.2
MSNPQRNPVQTLPRCYSHLAVPHFASTRATIHTAQRYRSQPCEVADTVSCWPRVAPQLAHAGAPTLDADPYAVHAQARASAPCTGLAALSSWHCPTHTPAPAPCKPATCWCFLRLLPMLSLKGCPCNPVLPRGHSLHACTRQKPSSSSWKSSQAHSRRPFAFASSQPFPSKNTSCASLSPRLLSLLEPLKKLPTDTESPALRVRQQCPSDPICILLVSLSPAASFLLRRAPMHGTCLREDSSAGRATAVFEHAAATFAPAAAIIGVSF